jgi:hypothetical protein
MPPALASFRRPRLDRTTAHVCVCAFLLQCKPSEPHLVPYLKDVKGFSSAQVEADILPVSVYASLVFFLLAGPAASGTSTKAVLVAGGACKLLTRVLLLWGRTLGAMRLMEVAFAAGAASDLMLYAYLAETAPSADADRPDGVRDAPASISGGGAEGASPASFGSDAPPAGSQVRFATGAASASAMLGYMLAAELGQIAFERGASYDSLFVVSLITVALGCVGLASLPGDGKATSPNASPKTTTRQNTAVAVVRATSRDGDAGGGPCRVGDDFQETSEKRFFFFFRAREGHSRGRRRERVVLRLERGDRALRVVGARHASRLRAGELRAVGSERRGSRRGGTRRGGARRVFRARRVGSGGVGGGARASESGGGAGDVRGGVGGDGGVRGCIFDIHIRRRGFSRVRASRRVRTRRLRARVRADVAVRGGGAERDAMPRRRVRRDGGRGGRGRRPFGSFRTRTTEPRPGDIPAADRGEARRRGRRRGLAFRFERRVRVGGAS